MASTLYYVVTIGILLTPLLKTFMQNYVQKWSEYGLSKKLAAFNTEQAKTLADYRSELENRSQLLLATLNNEFNTKLEAVKLLGNVELARMNNLLQTRISKIHEKEFEVLPEAWLLVHKAHGSLSRWTGFQRIPDVTQMADEKSEQLLENHCKSFTPMQVKDLKQLSG